VELDDGKAEDFWLRFEELSDVGDACAVSVVLDDGKNWAGGNATGYFGDIVAKIFAMDFDPGIERGIFQRSGRGGLCSGDFGRGVKDGRQGKPGFEECAARMFHGRDS